MLGYPVVQPSIHLSFRTITRYSFLIIFTLSPALFRYLLGLPSDFGSGHTGADPGSKLAQICQEKSCGRAADNTPPPPTPFLFSLSLQVFSLIFDTNVCR